MSDFATLRSALASVGPDVARFWWRDDDAVADTPRLDRLLALAAKSRAPLVIAAVPARLEPSLAARLARADTTVRVAVHGFAHVDHAVRPAKKSETPTTRPLDTRVDELRQGLARVRDAFGARALPIFVPPWNRIGADLVAHLASAGYRGLSRFKPRAARAPAPGLLEINTHVDPVDWHGTRGLVEPCEVLGHLVGLIAARAARTVDRGEPIGLLSHHLMHDDATWAFLDELSHVIGEAPHAGFVDIRDHLAG